MTTASSVETERGWILKVNCKETYILVDGEDITLTPKRDKASFFTTYTDAIEQVKERKSDLDLRLVIAEKIKRDKLQ